MTTQTYNWKRLRAGLRRFVARSGWSADEIAAALSEEYGLTLSGAWVAALIDGAAPHPAGTHGYAEMARLLLLTSNNTPAFGPWVARRRARRPLPIWTEGDRLIARAVAVEQARAARRRDLLSRERLRGVPSVRPFGDIDAATIAALSGGTIVMRGVRL